MILEKPQQSKKPEIDLTGPDGNAFILMGLAKGWCKQLGLDYPKVKEEMISGDYTHLLSVLEKHFGDYVIFYK